MERIQEDESYRPNTMGHIPSQIQITQNCRFNKFTP